MSDSLPQLEARVRWELDALNYPIKPWVLRPSSLASEQEDEYEVVIIGGGQSGLAACFALQREGLTKLLVLDENSQGKAGPWTSFARMPTLRTPKYVTGPDGGIPSLTVRAWYEARYGAEAWRELHLIKREDWAEYLLWFEQVLALPVRHSTKVGPIVWDSQRQMFRLPLMHSAQHIYARKVVLATGIDGSGSWQIPTIVQNSVPPHLYQHTNAPIDFSALQGKRIAVLGAGASAFDNAIMACRHGAAKVQMFFRRRELVKVNPYRWAEFVGFLKHHGDLPRDEDKWEFIQQIVTMGQLPPADTYQTAVSFPQFSLNPGEPWQVLAERDDVIEVTTNRNKYTFDQLIIGTGFVTDLRQRIELAELYSEIALWKDRFTISLPAAEDLLRHPYLGPGFNFQEKSPGQAPYLKGLFNFNFGCLLSNGFGGASISGMKYGLRRLTHEITRQFYLEAKNEHLETLKCFDKHEFL
jgi:cation diffusion facilitator CzcD-associated flavoprotein CzcO